MSRLALYRFARRILPPGLRERLGGSSLTRVLRDRFFRPGGAPLLVQGRVEWLDLAFTYTAPIQVLDKAQTRGVENRICRLAREVLAPGDLALDIGANYGFISTVMAHAVRSGGRVLSFEIEPSIQGALKRTMRANGLEDIVELIPKGAGAPDQAGLVTIDSVLEERAPEQIPKLIPKLIKIDVDGGDHDVLRGARRTLEKHHPVVIIEMTENQTEIHQLLLDAGYRHFIDQSNQPVEAGEWPENLIASTSPVRVPLKA